VEVVEALVRARRLFKRPLMAPNGDVVGYWRREKNGVDISLVLDRDLFLHWKRSYVLHSTQEGVNGRG
jgi:hypothetical protein